MIVGLFILWMLLSSCVFLVSSKKPHIIYFLLDDLGYADTELTPDIPGPVTPNVRTLREEGILLTNMYAYKVCAPSRASFLSGRLPHHVTEELRAVFAEGGGIDVRMRILPQVLKGANYSTHHVGKWHAGCSSNQHLPKNRGFDSSFGFLGGAVDYHTLKKTGRRDLWQNYIPVTTNPGKSKFSTTLFAMEAERIVSNHNPEHPLFLFYAFQSVHSPLAPLKNFMDAIHGDYTISRHQAHAQMHHADTIIGNIVAILKKKNMWENTLIVFSSDNGGFYKSQNNYPFRGSKHSDYEGGVRVIACVSGGFLPSNMRGTTVKGMMHIVDLFATFSHLAGVDPKDKQAREHNLPPIDSINMWPLLSGATTSSPRSSLVLASMASDDFGAAVISGNYKLVVGFQQFAQITEKIHPRANAAPPHAVMCLPACLYNIDDDKRESNNLADSKKYRQQLMELLGIAALAEADKYQTFGSNCPKSGRRTASSHSDKVYSGQWGPWEATPETFPSCSPHHLLRSFTTSVSEINKSAFQIKHALDTSLCITLYDGPLHTEFWVQARKKAEKQFPESFLSTGIYVSPQQIAHAVLGACNEHSLWTTSLHGSQEFIVNVGALSIGELSSRMRPAGICIQGEDVGVIPSKSHALESVGVQFNSKTKQLEVVGCTDLCVAPRSQWGTHRTNMLLNLLPCSTSPTKGFSIVKQPLS
eukprot:m.29807 g.29807  ORF g.29807 m.29807 type:complete len:699 (+) comp6184_c0_seq2:200-2296(+)